MDMAFLSQLVYFVMQRFPAANLGKYYCSINAAYTAGRKGCWEQRQRTPCLGRMRYARRGRGRAECAGKVCVQFNSLWAALPREFAKAVLMFGCCGSSFCAIFCFIRYL